MRKAGIIAFGFGVPETIQSNRWIAEIASQKARELNAPVYTQLDVRIEPDIQVEYTEEEPGNPPPTLRIARRAVKWARKNEFTELWLVAAKPHLWRVERDMRAAIKEAGATLIHLRVPREEIKKYPEESWFCAESTQERTSSQKNWDKRERILKIMPFFLYKIIAS